MHELVLDLQDSQHRTQMKALNQPMPHPSSKTVKVLWVFQRQVDNNYSKETPDWKALKAAKTLTS